MSRVASVIALTGLLLIPPATLAGQQEEPDSATVRAATRTLQSDLRNFVTVQEMYFADHEYYAFSLHDVGDMYHTSDGVTLIVLTAAATGHSAIAIDERVPGLVCAVYVGNAPHPLWQQRGDGEVHCREP